MDSSTIIDMLYGVLLAIFGVMLRRSFAVYDRLHDEDKSLHSRITDLQTSAVSRAELSGAIDRVLNRIDKLEERLLHKQ